jgi:hypothetical protein
MKRIVTTLLSLGFIFGCQAQIAKWLIPPSYDNIGFVSGAEAIITDSASIKSIWTFDGIKLATTTDEMMPFHEGLALSTQNDTTNIVGFYKSNGNFVSLDGCKVARHYPYFSCGLLLVMRDNLYQFVDKNGTLISSQYIQAYPYYNGYAVTDRYGNQEKQKDVIHYLVNKDGKSVTFSYKGKDFAPEDIDFVSSINDENIGIVVAKQKVYYFYGKENVLTPVLSREDETSVNLKEQARMLGGFNQGFIHNIDSTYSLFAKFGKLGDIVSFKLDAMLRPISINLNDKEYVYRVNPINKQVYESYLKVIRDAVLQGISRNNEVMLPPQFDKVIACFGEKALVKLRGKYGMLQVYKDENFKLKLNKGDNVPFRHQKFETTLRADFPTLISSETTSIDVEEDTGCLIDLTSKEGRNTEAGNFVQYNCVLNIPENLPDTLSAIEYPCRIKYNGLITSVIPLKVNAWYYKYFVVDIDNSQTSVSNGLASFVFNINADRIASDGIYMMNVSLQTDSLIYDVTKQSETRYKCKVISLKEGVNNIFVQIQEEGCPPALFPFEIEYSKPKKKQEVIVVKKKEKKPRVQL